MVLRFGKWKGSDLADVPEDYLLWLNGQDWVREPLKSAVERELDARMWARRFEGAFQARAGAYQEAPASKGVDRGVALEIVNRGYRTISLEAHPDKGGDVGRMQAVNVAARWLRETVGRTLPEAGGS